MRPFRRRNLIAALVLAGLVATGLAQAQTPGPTSAPAPAPSPPQALPADQVLPRLPGAMAASAPIRITTAIDRIVIRVGDLIQYSISIEAPAGSQVAMPPPGAQLGMFLIRDYRFPGMEEKEAGLTDRLRRWLERVTGSRLTGTDQAAQGFHFTITTYMTGDLVIPPLPLLVVDPAGRRHELFAESARVRVVPFTSPDDLTIRDIKAPQDIKVPLTRLLPYLLAAVLVLALVPLGLWRLKRKPAAPEELLPLRPAHELALEELAALENEGLLARGEYERFYTRCSWILRKYLALRFTMYALEYTSVEILDRLRTRDLDHGDYERIRAFLEETDRVKFARHEPALEERTTILARGREIVESTRERPVALEAREAA